MGRTTTRAEKPLPPQNKRMANIAAKLTKGKGKEKAKVDCSSDDASDSDYEDLYHEDSCDEHMVDVAVESAKKGAGKVKAKAELPGESPDDVYQEDK
jgi:hypothetical protein